MSVLDRLFPTTTGRVDAEPAEVADLLSSQRRIHTIRHLQYTDPTTLSDLAEDITVNEAGTDWETQDRKRVYIALQQHHLDILQDHGVVTVDEVGHGIHQGPAFDAYRRAADAIAEVTA